MIYKNPPYLALGAQGSIISIESDYILGERLWRFPGRNLYPMETCGKVIDNENERKHNVFKLAKYL